MKMSLEEYLFKNRLSIKKFAQLIDYCPQYVSSLKHWKLHPGTKVRKAIEKATGGVVSFDPSLAHKYSPENQENHCPYCQRKIPKKWVLDEPTT